MINLLKMEYKRRYDLLKYDDLKGRVLVSIDKSIAPYNGKDYYNLKMYKCMEGKLKNIGYLYFYLENNKVYYVGSKVQEEYRNRGFATLLLSFFLKICMENNFVNITTNMRQRKPFLLYLLKKFSFEIDNLNDYNDYKRIDICSSQSGLKNLYIEDLAYREQFRNSKICRSDNYRVLDVISDDTIILDRVLLSWDYFLKNNTDAYDIASVKISRIM